MSLTLWIVLLVILPTVLYPVTWLLYVFGYAVKRVRNERLKQGRDLAPEVKAFALIFIALAYAADFYLQHVTFTLLCLDFPKWTKGEILVTHRLKRYRQTLQRPTALGRWRARVAYRICREHLEPWDEGHCS